VENEKYLLGLKLITEYSPGMLRKLLDHFGSAKKAWQADLSRWGELAEKRRNIDLDKEWEKIKNVGIDIITIDSKDYPEILRHIPYPPPLLFTKGELIKNFSMAVAIVGTRRATSSGKAIAEELAEGLSRCGLAIVSGLARGIDSAAHRGALRGAGGTIAVLGSGLDVVYPPENKRLQEEILKHGSLVTEYPLGVFPAPQNFPARNRIISGLCRGVIVVEAPEKSGALITADFALEQGREVFAVPGNIKSPVSKGVHKLLKAGACLVESVEDILFALGIEEVKFDDASQPAQLSSEERAILKTLEAGPRHIDEIIRESALSASKITSLLTILEAEGFIRSEPGKRYLRLR